MSGVPELLSVAAGLLAIWHTPQEAPRSWPPEPPRGRLTQFAIRFTLAFTSASFLLSLLSWSLSPGHGHFPIAGAALIFHMSVHAVYGAVAAVPTRRREVVVAMALCAMLIDVDHLAYFLGWPVPPRTSHSALFLLVAPTLMGLAARAGLLGRVVSPRLAASMGFSTVLAHLAWDAVTANETRIPLWLPFSTTLFPLSGTVGGILELIAIGLMWLAALADARGSDPRGSSVLAAVMEISVIRERGRPRARVAPGPERGETT